jgi:hypothetical protein
MTSLECLAPRYSVPSIRSAPGRSQECFIIITSDQVNMRRFQPIPPRAQVVEFSVKKTSRGEVQQVKVMDRTIPSQGGQPSTSPRKRQRIEHQEMSTPNIPEDAFVYVDPPEGQGHVCVQFMVLCPLRLIHTFADKPRLPS